MANSNTRRRARQRRQDAPAGAGERDAARAAGQITRGELDYPPVAQEAAGKTREQVIAEMRQARAQGLMKSGELDYPPTGH